MTERPFRDLFYEIDDRPLFPEWMNRVRQAAYHNYLAHDFPAQKAEAWKYINLNPVLDAAFSRPNQFDELVEEAHIKHHFLKGYSRIVFVNGRYSEKLSSLDSLEQKVIFKPLLQAFDTHSEILEKVLPREQKPANAFSDINTFSFEDGVFFYVPSGVKVSKPVQVISVAATQKSVPIVYYPKFVCALGEGAEASFYKQQVTVGGHRYFANGVMDISLEKGAKLEVITNDLANEEGMYFQLRRVKISEKASFFLTSLAEGGTVSRYETQIDFNGEEAEAELRGLLILDGKSEVYNHVTVNHNVPNCRSDQTFKNILIEKSRTEFNGLVYVHRDAQKSDSKQMNRNLILSNDAKAYSRPQLKIYADDVKCSHGSATGQLEEDQIFYLNSRGISREVANSILTYGFAEEIIEQIPYEDIRKRMESAAISKLIKIKFERV